MLLTLPVASSYYIVDDITGPSFIFIGAFPTDIVKLELCEISIDTN